MVKSWVNLLTWLPIGCSLLCSQSAASLLIDPTLDNSKFPSLGGAAGGLELDGHPLDGGGEDDAVVGDAGRLVRVLALHPGVVGRGGQVRGVGVRQQLVAVRVQVGRLELRRKF